MHKDIKTQIICNPLVLSTMSFLISLSDCISLLLPSSQIAAANWVDEGYSKQTLLPHCRTKPFGHSYQDKDSNLAFVCVVTSCQLQIERTKQVTITSVKSCEFIRTRLLPCSWHFLYHRISTLAEVTRACRSSIFEKTCSPINMKGLISFHWTMNLLREHHGRQYHLTVCSS